jgi:hypothetical protein
VRVLHVDSDGGAWDPAFSDDGHYLAAGCLDTTVVWDLRQKAVAAVYEGHGDNAAIADSGETHPFRAVGRQLVTRIEEKARDRIVGVFPGEYTLASPDGMTWAGSDGNHVFLYRLEGESRGAARLLAKLFTAANAPRSGKGDGFAPE